ncbi:MAG: hypothetical protein JWM03_154 [Rhodocyclales bacterium]|nr:hypothetical protein [Rhodocyclales bacterium]MDB5887282.1 hypothetical protein [Rhodocyclales bacterium]
METYNNTASERTAVCIDACENCHRICLAMAMNYCLARGGRHARQEHLRLMLHCAQICRLAADFQLTGAPFSDELCAVCAAVCESCSQSCSMLEGMDECVQACDDCADSCRHTTFPPNSERPCLLQ